MVARDLTETGGEICLKLCLQEYSGGGGRDQKPPEDKHGIQMVLACVFKEDNGNWWIGNTDTGVTATGSNGADGRDGVDGRDGADGLTPYIGQNGNWWIGDTDTGIRAAGTSGRNGKDGSDGMDGKDGAAGKDGLDGMDGADGKDGANGRGIETAGINKDGYLILTLSDGHTINASLVRETEAHGQDMTRQLAIAAAIGSGISLLWNILSLAIILIGRKRNTLSM